MKYKCVWVRNAFNVSEINELVYDKLGKKYYCIVEIFDFLGGARRDFKVDFWDFLPGALPESRV